MLGTMKFLRFIRGVIRVLVFLLLCLSAGAVYLARYGVPEALLARAVRVAEERGLMVEIDSAGLDLYQGVWIRGLVVHGSRRDTRPLFSAESVQIRVRPDLSMPVKDWVRGLSVQGGTARVRLRTAEADTPELEFLEMEEFSGTLSAHPEGWLLENGHFRVAMVTMDLHGLIQLDKTKEPADPFALLQRLHPGVALELAAERGVDPEPYYQYLEELDWPRNARAVASFTIRMDDLHASEVRLCARADAFTYRGMLVEELRATGGWSHGRLILKECRLAQAAFLLRGEGTWDPLTGQVAASGYGKLPPAHVEHLMPETLKQRLNEQGVFINGTVEGEASLGPAPVAGLVEQVSGWVRVEEFEFRGMEVERAHMQVERAGDRMQVRGAEAHIGGGWVRGDALYILSEQYLEAQGEGELNPASFVPLFSGGLKDVLMAARFHRPTVQVRGELRGNLDEIHRFQARGSVEATDFVFRGSHVDRFESAVHFGRNTMRFEPFTLSRHDGQVQGWARLDLNLGAVEMDAHSTIHPKAAARIISPNLSAALRNFQFDGPVDIQAAGIVYYKQREGSRLTAEVSGQQMGMQNLIAEELEFTVSLHDTRMEVADMHGAFYGGTMEGHAVINLESSGDTTYRLNGSVRGARLADVVRDFRQVADADPYEGRLNLSGWVEGRVNAGVNRWEDGLFEARVREGHLFQIPLLGGLSEYLSLLYDGFGYLSQTEFEAEGQIRQDRIRLRESELQGAVISVRARGNAYFDERLDVNVEVQLLRRGFLAQLLRLVTRPVTRLFEFSLTGTLKDPQWWPRNIPKRLFPLRDEE